MLQKTCTRNKQRYRAVLHNEHAVGYCTGCAADEPFNAALCQQLPKCSSLDGPFDIIWMRVQSRNKNTGTSI